MDSESSASHSGVLARMVAGGLAGMISDFTMHPLDTIKARMQLKESRTRLYNSIWTTSTAIVRESGLRNGLYAGIGAVMMGSIPTNAIVFSVYHTFRSSVQRFTLDPGLVGDTARMLNSNSMLTDFLGGSVAEIVALTVYVPSEVIAKRMQVSSTEVRSQYGNFVNAVRVIYRIEGMRGVYSGTSSTVLRDVPYTAFQLMIFDCIKTRWGRRWSLRWGTVEAAAAGFVAGGLAGLLTNPFDVIKTRLQTQMGGMESSSRGTLECARNILRDEGPLAFLKGSTARFLWVAPGSAITLVIFERIMSFLNLSGP